MEDREIALTSMFRLAMSAFATQDINDIGGGEPLHLAQTLRPWGEGAAAVACHSSIFTLRVRNRICVRIFIYLENTWKIAFACRSEFLFKCIQGIAASKPRIQQRKCRFAKVSSVGRAQWHVHVWEL